MKYKYFLVCCVGISLMLGGPLIAQNEISIDSCIRIALKNNYELKAAEQDKAIAARRYSIQKGALLPSLDLNSEYSYTDQFESMDVYNAGTASLRLYQPVWQNGKIRAATELAKLNCATAGTRFSIYRSDIIYYTVESCTELARNSKIDKLADEMVQQFSFTVDAAKERFKLGVSKQSDVLKAETEFSNVQYLAIQVKTAKKIAEQDLLKVMGYSSDTSVIIVDVLTGTDKTFESLTADSLLNLARKYLPEIELISNQIQQQELSVRIEKKKQFPEIGAYANYNWTDSPVFDQDYYGSAGLSLRFNLFGGFQKKNSVELEKIRLQQLNYQEDEVLQLVYNEIKIAQMLLQEAGEKINNAESRVKSAGESLMVTKEEYLQGLSSMIELIEAQYADFNAKRSLINAQADYQLAVARLKRKTGLLTLQYINVNST